MAADTDAGLNLLAYGDVVAGCTRCALAQTRTQVVFGSGNPEADLMFVGEAPGFHEDKNGVPFVGAAGKLLSKLLEGVGLTRDEVFVANVLKCLRYDTPVQLGDGSWERIGRLVGRRYDGTVMSVDADGNLVERRVTGWHATPLGGRRVFEVTFASAKPNGRTRANAEMTGDHQVLTERGWVAAGHLIPGDRIATGHGLSELAFDVVCGTLLGDGSLNASSAHLQIGHSERQGEYARWKAELLAELDPAVSEHAVAAVSGGPRSYGTVHVRTRATRALRTLRPDFYGDRKHVPWWMDDELNERMLAIWFLDDGYTRIRTGKKPLSEIATNGFDDRDIQTLLRGLKRLGLAGTTSRGRIYFGVDATRKLSELIAPYTPEPMRYKLHPEVEATTPFDPLLFTRGPRRVMYDDVVALDVTDKPRTDTTFFCLDVAETHNFVTPGGVVHNCRPPGNRDPQPQEIEACEPHLFRQIELIQPRVVATLGNFATKLLSGKPDGITRVHGRAQQVVLGGNEVCLYPIFHPAAALYTPRMLEVLEADFARIPELIGRVVRHVEPQPAAPEAPAVAPPPAAPDHPVQLGLF